jgi:hypothetical protein
MKARHWGRTRQMMLERTGARWRGRPGGRGHRDGSVVKMVACQALGYSSS